MKSVQRSRGRKSSSPAGVGVGAGFHGSRSDHECILEAEKNSKDCSSTFSSPSCYDGSTSIEERSDTSLESFSTSSLTSSHSGTDSRTSIAYCGDDRTRICEVCGDEVEQEGHKVCFWHALTLKDDNKVPQPMYHEEAEYALSKYFKDISSYLNRVKSKRGDFRKHLTGEVVNYPPNLEPDTG